MTPSTTSPAIGCVGSLASVPPLLAHLYRSEPGTFAGLIAVAALVLAAELRDFERDWLDDVVPVVP